MNALKTKIRRLNYKMKHDFLTVENIVLLLAIILCFVCTYQSIVSMSRNWELSERLTAEKRELELLSMEVEAAELENQYLASNEYQELIARRNLDKKLEGENMVVMPENSEAAKTKRQQVKTVENVKIYSNFEKWMMYLFPSY
jgi:cell division protein FtsB